MKASCELIVASSWDGRPLPPEEHARLRLRLTGRHLRIALSAPFHDDPPPATEPGPTAGLWEHEVVELFIAGTPNDDEPGSGVPYTEVELGPWGHHLVLRLRGVRHVVEQGLPLAFRSWRRGGRWWGAARLDCGLLPPPPWRVNAYAIHGVGDERRYAAATPLPGEQPDFHQPQHFAPLPLRAEE